MNLKTCCAVLNTSLVRWLAVEDAPSTLIRILSEDERARAERFRSASDQDAFVAAHGLLRVTLGEVTRASARSLRFVSSPSGKPMLPDSFGELHFSLAHSRRWVACAIARAPVGVDVEAADRPVSDEVLSQLAPSEESYIRSLPELSAQQAFYRIWTLKEAALKATGEGLRRPLASFEISLDPLRIDYPGIDPSKWHSAEFCAGPLHRIAVAIVNLNDVPISIKGARCTSKFCDAAI